VARARPEALPTAPATGAGSVRAALIGLAAAAVFAGGIASWFASTRPDGLEWSIARIGGRGDFPGQETRLHRRLAGVQRKTAFLPDYGFRAADSVAAASAAPEAESWPAMNAGTSISGIVGGLMTLALACLAGLALKHRSIRRAHGNG
jgi:cobalt/nickel transport system permease protein